MGSMGSSATAETSGNIDKPHYDTSTDSTVFQYVYFGSYPQTEVTASDLTDKIKNASYDQNGVATVDHKKYAKQKKYYTSDNSETVGYYCFEPIKWRIIGNDGAKLTLQAAQALDCEYYDENAGTAFSESHLRSFLNNDFLGKAFTTDEQNGLLETDINVLSDKVTTLSSEDVCSKSYCLDQKSARILSGTDYSRAKGNYVYDLYGGTQIEYWTSSAAENQIYYIDCNGDLKTKVSSYNRNAIVPVIQVSVNEMFYSSDRKEIILPEFNAESQTATWQTITFGSYPQKEVTNTVTSEISSAVYNNDGIAVVGEKKYKRKGKIGAYRYFEYEPISWKVLDETENELVLQSSKIIDTYDGSEHTGNFETSKLKEWLNDTFYNAAFDSVLKNVICDINTVKVDILTDDMINNTDYGYCNAATRMENITDYAAFIPESNEKAASDYWLRSDEQESYLAGYVNADGNCIYSVFSGKKGVVPVIKIKKVPYYWNLNGSLSVGENGVIDNNPTPAPTIEPAETTVPTEKPTETPKPGSGSTVVPTMPSSVYVLKAPSSVKIYTINSSTQKISWKKINAADGYCIYKSNTKNGKYAVCGFTKSNSFISKKLKKGQTYYYYVKAYYIKNGVKQYSKKSSIVLKKAGIPEKLKFTISKKRNGNTTYVIIRWKNTATADYIQLYRSMTGKKYSMIMDSKITKKNKKGVVVKYQYANGVYRFKIRAYNRSGRKKFFGKFSSVKKVRLK